MAAWHKITYEPFIGAHVQAQANTIYLNLGFLHDKMNMRACTWYLVTNLAGHLEK